MSCQRFICVLVSQKLQSKKLNCAHALSVHLYKDGVSHKKKRYFESELKQQKLDNSFVFFCAVFVVVIRKDKLKRGF